MPGGRDKPLHLQTKTDLWVGIICFPGFGGLMLAAPLMGTPTDGSLMNKFWIVLLMVSFFTIVGVLISVPSLKELHRRGSWVPPGVARLPVLVSIVLTLLIIATGVAIQFIAVEIVHLVMMVC